jgi:hypothetical protein
MNDNTKQFEHTAYNSGYAIRYRSPQIRQLVDLANTQNAKFFKLSLLAASKIFHPSSIILTEICVIVRVLSSYLFLFTNSSDGTGKPSCPLLLAFTNQT